MHAFAPSNSTNDIESMLGRMHLNQCPIGYQHVKDTEDYM